MGELDRGKAIGIDLPFSPAPRSVRALPWILDERLGRLHAEALKLTFTGTLGILLRAKVEGRIPQVEPLLMHLDQLGFRLSAKTHAAVLRQAGE